MSMARAVALIFSLVTLCLPLDVEVARAQSPCDAEHPHSGNVTEAQFPEIQALAAGLHHDPVQIYAYVKNHIAHEYYYGAKKGAVLTLLEGSGKRMRHVKLRPDEEPDAAALGELIVAAYRDIKARLAAERAAANE